MDATEAAKIARKHGLGLADAAALASLAENKEEAEELARAFAGDDADAEAAEIARRIDTL